MEDTSAPERAVCSARGCDARLNRDNASGRCQRHRYIAVVGDTCAVEGCGQRLRKDNRTGYCTPHRRAKDRPGPTPTRDVSGRVYQDRTCLDCPAVFAPASATHTRCADCQHRHRLALRAEREGRNDRDTCSVPGCDARLRTSNTTGRCQEHRRFEPRGTCAADGCGRRLRKDNKSGYCDEHRTAKAREPARFCGAPGCDRRLRTDNTTGYCGDHAELPWRTPEYLAHKRDVYHARPKPPDTRRTCSVDGCDRKLRSDNTTGRCVDHAYVPLDLAVCSVDGCSRRLRSDNAVGRCMEHHGLYWAEDAPKCTIAGCGKTLHADNKSGLCKQHYDETWKKRNNRAYYQRHQTVLQEYARQYREVYADEHRANAGAWNAAHRAARLAGNVRRRLAASAGMDDFDRELSVAYRLAIRNNPCFYCGSPDTDHVDHYFPLAKGGSDRWENLCRTCQRCNNAKYTMCGTAFLLLSGG